MIVVGWRIMQIRMDIPYTGLEIPTGYAYLAVPVAGILLAMTDLHDLLRTGHGRLHSKPMADG
jgi:TRAP-type C4-dicarboxylate transport system permease small subunit